MNSEMTQVVMSMVRGSHTNLLLLLMLTTLWWPVSANSEGLADLFNRSTNAQTDRFLPVDQAFGVTPQVIARGNNNVAATLQINFDITPGHYIYKDKIKLDLPDGVVASPVRFNQALQFVDDPQFGRVPVFDQQSVTAATTLTNSSGSKIEGGAVTVTWQGCAKAGLCYPPEQVTTSISLAASPSTDATDPDQPSTTQSAVQKPQTNLSAATSLPKSDSDRLSDINAQQSNTADESSTTAQPTAVARELVSNENTRGERLAHLAQRSDQKGDSSIVEGSLPPRVDETLAKSHLGAAAESSISSDTRLAEDVRVLPQGQSTALAVSKPSLANSTESAQRQIPLAEADPFGLGRHPWLALGLLFLAGLGLAFTPCVLPMLPIIANIVGNQSNPTPKKSIILTTSYAVGVAVAYGVLGATIAVFGESLGVIGWLQNPIILLSFAAIFVLLALYMLGLIPLRLPLVVRNKLMAFNEAGNRQLGSSGGSFIAGFLSALVVSPCVSAPLFGALLAVSTIGNPVLGFAALFMLGFGLSAPLILLGATQGSLMPKAGAWMSWVKQGFALLLIAVALLLIERVIISPLILLVWALWFMVVAVWLWQWRGRGRVLAQALGLVVGIWSALLTVGAGLGNSDSLHPLASLSTFKDSKGQVIGEEGASAIRVTTLAELDKIVASYPKVLVDVTADWCIECRIIEKTLFANPPEQLANWQVVKLDITETSADSKAVLSRYQLFGPPALMYYNHGDLVGQQVGEVDREAFIKQLSRW